MQNRNGSPDLHDIFTDVGLLCFLLGIEKPIQISRDPLVGSIFENLVVIECSKARCNQGKLANLYFFRDSNGNEVDIVFQNGRMLSAIECKSASTYTSSLFKGLDRFSQLSQQVSASYLIYNGETKAFSDNRHALQFTQIASIFSG